MDNTLFELFDKLSDDLTKVENKHNVGDDSDDAIPEFEIVAGLDYKDKVESKDQKIDLPDKIAARNDQFRQLDPNGAEDINGEWHWADELSSLPLPTLHAIRKRIASYDQFEGIPLHDMGKFEHKSKKGTFSIIWKIFAYSDQTTAVELKPEEDTDQSWRVMRVALSSEAET